MTGSKVGNYTIVKELSKGGMATIFLAMHQDLNRQVALKIMHPDLSQDADFVKRFEQEARIIAKLEHTNILQVYDFGKHGTSYFIAMEYVEGLDLEGLLKQNGPIPWEVAGILFHQISLALTEAHSHKIIHRDIKLQNILIKNNGQAKLADFGISKDFEMKSVTRTRDLIGTPYYMAPELIKGKSSSIQTDIYCFGVCLYYALTGSPPFEGPNIAAVFDRIVDASPAPLSDFGVFVPDEIAAIVRKCMAKAPEERYADAAMLESELSRCLYLHNVRNDRQEAERYLKEPHVYLLEQRGKRIAAKQEEAEVLAKEGKVFESLRAYRELLTLDPDNKAVEDRIMELNRKLPLKDRTHVIRDYPAQPRQKRPPAFRASAIAIIVLLVAVILMYFFIKPVGIGSNASPDIAPSAFLEAGKAARHEPQEPVVKDSNAVAENSRNPVKEAVLKAGKTAATALARRKVPADKANKADIPVPEAAAPRDTVPKAPCMGTLALYSGIWADIYLNDRKWGRSPTKEALSVPCGDYALRLESIDGKAYASRITVEAEIQTHVKVEKSEFK